MTRIGRHPTKLTILPNWLSGVYLIKLSVGRIAESYIPLIVRDDASTAAVLLNIPLSTYEAYNIWGGYSLYQAVGRTIQNENNISNRATKVSFNRPFDRSAGVGDFFYWDLHTVRWAERSAMDVVYTTNTAYYYAPSGALVFDAGTLWWSNGLDDFIPPGTSEPPFFEETQTISNLTTNILQTMLSENAASSSLILVPNPVPQPTFGGLVQP